MDNKNGTIIPIASFSGVVVGGVTWLLIYAHNVGSIEFDGPAELGLGIALLTGGASLGLISVIYELRHHTQRAPIAFTSLLISVLVASFIVGSIEANYAMNKWSYSSIHRAECNANSKSQELPAFCN